MIALRCKCYPGKNSTWRPPGNPLSLSISDNLIKGDPQTQRLLIHKIINWGRNAFKRGQEWVLSLGVNSPSQRPHHTPHVLESVWPEGFSFPYRLSVPQTEPHPHLGSHHLPAPHTLAGAPLFTLQTSKQTVILATDIRFLLFCSSFSIFFFKLYARDLELKQFWEMYWCLFFLWYHLIHSCVE